MQQLPTTIYFTRASVYMSHLLSQFALPSPPHPMVLLLRRKMSLLFITLHGLLGKLHPGAWWASVLPTLKDLGEQMGPKQGEGWKEMHLKCGMRPSSRSTTQIVVHSALLFE